MASSLTLQFLAATAAALANANKRRKSVIRIFDVSLPRSLGGEEETRVF
jgi:hypothetical protein